MPKERPATPPPASRGILCPYCGHVSASDPRRCERCGGYFDPLSRQATQNAMGPWYIRDETSPFRPGCSFETLRELINRGKVTRDTVLRGPSTRQYWNFAARTPGIANLLGVCHNCHTEVRADEFSCAGCGAVFTPDTDRQHMGLAPVHLLPGQASPEIIAAAAVDEAKRARPRPARRAVAAPAARPVQAPPPARRAGIGGLVTMILLIVVLTAGVTVGVVKFLVPVLSGEFPALKAAPSAAASPAPSTPPAAPPTEPVRPSTPEPANASSGPSGPTEATTVAPAAPPAPSSGPGGEAADPLAALLSQPDDPERLLPHLDGLRRAGRGAEADAWAALVRQRAELHKLRALPG